MFRTYSISPRLNRISLLALSMHGLGVEERENPNKKTFFICVIQGERQISVIDRSRWVIRQVIACSRLRRVFLGWDIDNGDGFSDWLRWFSFQFSLYSLHDFPHSLSLPGARRYDLHILFESFFCTYCRGFATALLAVSQKRKRSSICGLEFDLPDDVWLWDPDRVASITFLANSAINDSKIRYWWQPVSGRPKI